MYLAANFMQINFSARSPRSGERKLRERREALSVHCATPRGLRRNISKLFETLAARPMSRPEPLTAPSAQKPGKFSDGIEVRAIAGTAKGRNREFPKGHANGQKVGIQGGPRMGKEISDPGIPRAGPSWAGPSWAGPSWAGPSWVG